MLLGMPQTNNHLIERSTDLDLDVGELWTLVSTAEGWSSWLVDGADVTIAPDASGTATVDEVERAVRIESVVEGRQVCFSWWDRGDRSSVSYVQLDVVELPDGRSQLNVSERLPGATATASMAATSMAATAAKWDVALVSLWLLALSLVMA
jgi:hypothetical protein